MIDRLDPAAMGGIAELWLRDDAMPGALRQWRHLLRECGVVLDKARCFALIFDDHQIHPNPV